MTQPPLQLVVNEIVYFYYYYYYYYWRMWVLVPQLRDQTTSPAVLITTPPGKFPLTVLIIRQLAFFSQQYILELFPCQSMALSHLFKQVYNISWDRCTPIY